MKALNKEQATCVASIPSEGLNLEQQQSNQEVSEQVEGVTVSSSISDAHQDEMVAFNP